MPLTELKLEVNEAALPRDIGAFLCDADRRIEHFQTDSSLLAFVPSDFVRAYAILRSLSENLAPGRLFCEWGSGFGVVACLAAMLDFEAHGIEIEGELIDAARRLAADYELPVELVRGSFIPKGDKLSNGGNSFAWLTTEESIAPDESDLDPDDFAVIFAYPWPDEDRATADLFERHAALGAILITYHGGDDFRVRRKTKSRLRTRGSRRSFMTC